MAALDPMKIGNLVHEILLLQDSNMGHLNNKVDAIATDPTRTPNFCCIIQTLEIKPCGLGSIIQDMEAESHN